MNVNPTKKQAAVALCAYRSLTLKRGTDALTRNQIGSLFEVAPSQGKSIIIAVVAALIVVNRPEDIDTVCIRFSDRHLAYRDQPLYNSLQNMLNGVTVVVTDTDEQMQRYAGPGTLMIVDEADYQWLDRLSKPVSAKYTVGFSATSALSNISNESEYLKNTLGIKVFSNCLGEPPSAYDSYDVIKDVRAWQKLKMAENPQCGFLFYIEHSRLKSAMEEYAVQLRLQAYHGGHPTAPTWNVSRCVIFVTSDKPHLMRGYDYRNAFGIHLMIMHPLPNRRAFVQALGRVERFGDDGSRAILQGVEPWDKEKEQVWCGKLAGLVADAKREGKQRRTQNRKVSPKPQVQQQQESDGTLEPASSAVIAQGTLDSFVGKAKSDSE